MAMLNYRRVGDFSGHERVEDLEGKSEDEIRIEDLEIRGKEDEII